MKRDLSILIPSRNEEFLGETIQDILNNIEGNTEIIAVLDGQWPIKPLPQHDRVTIVYLPESIGQRAATNLACRLSAAKYVMKCDAHCAFGKGFDRILMEDMQDNWTMVPKMYNLHVFDWVCPDGHRRYQSPSGPCKECGKETKKDIVWYAKPSPESTSMRFDRDLKFQYWGGYKKHQHGDLVDTMSILGACFMLTREKYWELDICDEGHGSWGQQGTEVSCKTWLSGGRLVCNKRTWFAHMFRTQGGDFSFPYPLSGSDVQKARNYSRDLWNNNKWPKAIHTLDWLIDRFSPVPGWNSENDGELSGTEHEIPGKKKGIIFYTDNRLNLKIARRVQNNLLGISKDMGIPIVSASLKPMTFGKNIHLKLQRGYITMTKQILAALEASEADIIYFCEHDLLYHKSHFEFTPIRDDTYYYNVNVWKVRLSDGLGVKVDDCRQLSGLCVNRKLAIQHYKKRLEVLESKATEYEEDSREFRKFVRNIGFEPGTHNRREKIDNFKSECYNSTIPNVDIRHDNNLTPSRWSPENFRDKKYTRGWTESYVIPGWII